jgi:3-phenylpropionate/trans-cinnamate dioxygenase ferredoxin component
MSDWVRVAELVDFGIGERRSVEVDGLRIAVFHLDSGFHAIQDICTHDGGALGDGALEGDEIVCPRHGARFDVRTGAVTAPPAYEPIATFPVRLRDGQVEVRDERWD